MSEAVATWVEDVRAILGDQDSIPTYSDSKIAANLRSVVRLQRVQGLAVSSDGTAIEGTITPTVYALIALFAAKTFVASEPDRYAYRTRALSESFGGRRTLLMEIEEQIHSLTSGDMVSSLETFRSYIAGISGVNRLMIDTTMTGPKPEQTLSYPSTV